MPDAATVGDLETGYMIRGRQIADCDIARRLAVDTLMAERSAIDSVRPSERLSIWPWRPP